ncbi:uncharacterized protein DDB_G0271670-like [Penaeus indicus]|uniref:uncharacterized protein DDB_G0271670-like n=1 Tax=Penaeus indicus TaxID=29960 RepID=UPI00300CC9B6
MVIIDEADDIISTRAVKLIYPRGPHSASCSNGSNVKSSNDYGSCSSPTGKISSSSINNIRSDSNRQEHGQNRLKNEKKNGKNTKNKLKNKYREQEQPSIMNSSPKGHMVQSEAERPAPKGRWPREASPSDFPLALPSCKLWLSSSSSSSADSSLSLASSSSSSNSGSPT